MTRLLGVFVRGWWIWAAVVVMSAAGCSNFKSSRRLEMGPFAENTVSMLTEAQRVTQPFDWSGLREYRYFAQRDTVDADVEMLRRVFRGIGLYSVEVVALNNAKMAGKEKSALLAAYIDDVCKPIIERGELAGFGLTRAQLDSALANIRAQTEYMGALAAADPLVYAVATFSIARVNRATAIAQPAFQQIQDHIDEKNAELRRQIGQLDAVEEANVGTFLILQDYRAGRSAREAVVARDPSLGAVLPAGREASARSTDEAQAMLQERLHSIAAVRAQLGERNALYAEQVAAVDDFRNEIEQRARSARLTLIYWMRAHGNLARGVPVPPAIDLGKIVGDSAKKAIKTLP